MFAEVFVALFAGHQVADHWIQTQRQANHKSLPGWRGRLACAAHVTTYGATQLLALVAVALVAGGPLSPGRLAAGMAVNLVTHYIADRRTPLRRMADRLGKSPAWLDHGGGMYALDQSWHHGWLGVSALIIGA